MINPVPKPVRIVNKKYREWIRTQPCLCGCGSVRNDPHHHGRHGIGTKTSDYNCVPLHHDLHRLINSPGWSEKKVQEAFRMNFDRAIVQLNDRYINYLLMKEPKAGEKPKPITSREIIKIAMDLEKQSRKG